MDDHTLAARLIDTLASWTPGYDEDRAQALDVAAELIAGHLAARHHAAEREHLAHRIHGIGHGCQTRHPRAVADDLARLAAEAAELADRWEKGLRP